MSIHTVIKRRSKQIFHTVLCSDWLSGPPVDILIVPLVGGVLVET